MTIFNRYIGAWMDLSCWMVGVKYEEGDWTFRFLCFTVYAEPLDYA